MVVAQVIIKEHGGVLLELPQQLPCPAVAGEDLGELHVKGLEGGQVQEQAAGVRLEAAVHRLLIMRTWASTPLS